MVAVAGVYGHRSDGGDPDLPDPVDIWVAPAVGYLNPVRKATYNGTLDPDIVDIIFEDGYYAGGIYIG